jgi:hypothetical protein
MEYWATAHAWAKEHTKTYTLWKAIPSMLTTAMGTWLFHLQPVAKALVLAATLFGSYGILYTLEYAWNLLIVAPHAIANGMNTELVGLKKKLEKPPRSAIQQYYYEKMQAAIQNGGEKIKDILHYFHVHKRVRAGTQLGEMARRLGYIDSSKLIDILRQLQIQDVIVEIPDVNPTGIVTWEIPAVTEPVLEELLY